MMTPTGLAPECVHVSSKPPYEVDQISDHCAHSLLRPETVESLYYLYRLTGDNKYREYGEQIFRALVTHSKTEVGFATVTDVRGLNEGKQDEMQTFVLAETFKYLYLL